MPPEEEEEEEEEDHTFDRALQGELLGESWPSYGRPAGWEPHGRLRHAWKRRDPARELGEHPGPRIPIYTGKST